MVYLCLDTCTWIYLVNGTEPVRILRLISQEVEKDHITLLIPELVIEEFKRNTDKGILAGVKNYITDFEKNLKTLSTLLGEGKNPTFMDFILDYEVEIETFRKYKEEFKNIKNLITKGVQSNIELVEKLFTHKTTKIFKGLNVAERVLQFGLEKKAPFNNKNSTADAFIILSFLDYVKQNNLVGAKFISSNVSDFCEITKKGYKLHPDLQPLFDSSKAHFFSTASQAINSFIKDFIKRQELELIDKHISELRKEELVCQDCLIFRGSEHYCQIFQIDFLDNRSEGKLLTDKKLECKICGECEILYLKCPKCNEWNYHFDETEPSEIECEKCRLTFELEYDRDSYELSFIFLEDKMLKCEKCNLYFKDEDLGTNICEDCESKYAYGDD